MRSEITLSKPSPPKFARRSMSPMDYLNSTTYKQKIKRHQIKVQFGYMSQNKLQKVGIIKSSYLNIKAKRQQKTEDLKDQMSQNTINSCGENTFKEKIRNSQNNNMDRTSKLQINDSQNSTQFQKKFEDTSIILKGQISERNQIMDRNNTILQLEQIILQKNNTIQIQEIEIKNLTKNCQQMKNVQNNLQRELQKLQFMLLMQQRKNQQKDNIIKTYKNKDKINAKVFKQINWNDYGQVNLNQKIRKIKNAKNINQIKLRNIKDIRLQNKQNIVSFQLSQDEEQENN